MGEGHVRGGGGERETGHYLCLFALWLASANASCSVRSASWEPYLPISPGFLARKDSRMSVQ